MRAEKRALAIQSKFPWHDIEHTGSSWVWTNNQSMRIDEIGLDAWLQTMSARAPKNTMPWFDEWAEKGRKKCECPPNKCLRQLK